MPEPLITKEMINHVKESNMDLSGKGDKQELILQLKKSLTLIDKFSHRVLHYILLHAKLVADVIGTKIDYVPPYIIAFWRFRQKLSF